MKNLFLTFAMVFMVSFAFANDGDGDKDLKKDKDVANKVNTESVTKAENSEHKLFDMNCYALSCGNLCTDGSLEEGWGCDSDSNEDGVAVWYMFDRLYCGGSGG